MRRPVVAIALLLALALVGAGPGAARRIAAEDAARAGGADQTALVPLAARDSRVARQADGRAPRPGHGLATPFALPHPRGLTAPALFAQLGDVTSLEGPPPVISPGSPRASRGPPPAATVVL